MEQYISLTVSFYTKTNDKNSESAHVCVTYIHLSIEHIHYRNRCILKIKNIFSSMGYRKSIILGTRVRFTKDKR